MIIWLNSDELHHFSQNIKILAKTETCRAIVKIKILPHYSNNLIDIFTASYN